MRYLHIVAREGITYNIGEDEADIDKIIDDILITAKDYFVKIKAANYIAKNHIVNFWMDEEKEIGFTKYNEEDYDDYDDYYDDCDCFDEEDYDDIDTDEE